MEYGFGVAGMNYSHRGRGLRGRCGHEGQISSDRTACYSGRYCMKISTEVQIVKSVRIEVVPRDSSPAFWERMYIRIQRFSEGGTFCAMHLAGNGNLRMQRVFDVLSAHRKWVELREEKK